MKIVSITKNLPPKDIKTTNETGISIERLKQRKVGIVRNLDAEQNCNSIKDRVKLFDLTL